MRWVIVLAIGMSLGVTAMPSATRPTASSPSASRLLVRVTERQSHEPLPNAEVIDIGSGQRRLTNAAGETRLDWPATGRLTLRVRQIGFKFVERGIVRPNAAADDDTVTFALERVAFVLPAVLTRASTNCAPINDSIVQTLSTSVLAQLRLGAERYEDFRRHFPFRVHQERRTVVLDTAGQARRVVMAKEEVASASWGEAYDPDRIIRYDSNGNFSVPIFFVATLADSSFWDRHCFAVTAVESLGAERVLRLEFAPVASVRAVDWEGAAFLDSATSILRRVEFKLVGLTGRDRPRRLEGYTTFQTPSPFVVVPDSTVAGWWHRDVRAESDWGKPDVVQLVHVQEISYRKAKPPKR
jgi:hypothetical protein